MKIHHCKRGGMLHEIDPATLAAWERIPRHLTEALVEANMAIDDAAERDGNGLTEAGFSRELLDARERALDALDADPSTNVPGLKGQWFRYPAMVDADGRRDRCSMCFRPRRGQLTLELDAGAPQDAPPPQQRPATNPPAVQAPPRQHAPLKAPPKMHDRVTSPHPAPLPTDKAAALARDFLSKLKEKNR